jgi:tRNA1(Val) A37 N6-methylase TrmN6
LIINSPETVPKSTPHLAAPPIESEAPRPALPAPVFHDAKHHIKIFQGDCLDILAAIPESCVDLIFADPPYFLSNNGITCHVRPHGQRQ